MDIKEKIENFTKTTSLLGEVGLLIIKNQEITVNILKILTELGYHQSESYLDIMVNLEKAAPVFYIEKKSKINNLAWEIVREYEGGIISLMDRVNHQGLKTIKFIPKNSPLIIVLTREQAENSPEGLFEYVGAIEEVN